jgi:hypothetical protein
VQGIVSSWGSSRHSRKDYYAPFAVKRGLVRGRSLVLERTWRIVSASGLRLLQQYGNTCTYNSERFLCIRIVDFALLRTGDGPFAS